ncbi:MAG: hypothetical protein ACRD1G_18350, partial [Acidimicrobiales bacterium]
VVAGTALVLMAVAHSPVALLVTELGLLGVGLGLFIPPNNSAVMSSPPREQLGVASGVLNTTRGLGTAMGLAIAGMVLALEAGPHISTSQSTARGFTASTLVLAAVAFAAAALAGLAGLGGPGSKVEDQRP